MPAPKIKADYKQLEEISKVFSQNCDEIQNQYSKIASKSDSMQSAKDWEGVGAKNFFQELDSSILPAIQKLFQALDRAAQASSEIAQEMKNAEEESANILIVKDL
jgi:WXG100 family type VII secretion target